jgi:hypothetical protein
VLLNLPDITHAEGIESSLSGQRPASNLGETQDGRCGWYIFEVDPDTGEKKPFSSPDDARFVGLLWSVREYELRENRLWLYYGGSKKNALVFR